MATFQDFELGQTVFRHGDVHLKKTKTPVNQEHRPTIAQATIHQGQNHDHTLRGSFYVREDGGKKFIGLLSVSRLGDRKSVV